MKTSYFDRPISQCSPLQLWLRSQLIFWIPTLLAMVAGYAGRTTIGTSWQRVSFGVPTVLVVVLALFWLASLVLLVLSAVDLFRQSNSIVGPIAALGMTAGTVAATYFVFGMLMLVFADLLNLPH